MRFLVFLSVALLNLSLFQSIAQNPAIIDYFSPAEQQSWQSKSFKGYTSYKFTKEEQNFVLKASCEGSASAFYRKMDIDLTKTPILTWSWKIDAIHEGLDDISEGGDDYAARVYVVYKGFMPWDVKALNYVWANRQAKGSSWPNAFTSSALMIAQESGNAQDKDLWINESRNVLEDFKRYFKTDISKIDGIAIMTDCDNGKGSTSGYYRDIKFIPYSGNP